LPPPTRSFGFAQAGIAAWFGSAGNRRPTVITTILIAAGAVLVAVIGSAVVAPRGDIRP
jgi:hypothetical protein